MSEPIQHIEHFDPEYQDDYLGRTGVYQRKPRIHWTCSDTAHHEHRYKWTAWLCGKIQQLKK